MRIASSQWFRQSMNSLLEQQAAAAKTQQQLASGKRLLKPSDDPVAATRAVDVTRAVEKLAQYERNGVQSENRLRLQETAVGGSLDVLQRVRELSVQANNGTQSNDTRGAIAAEVEQLRDALLQQVNMKDGTGKYLFGGFGEDKPPYMSFAGKAFPVLENAAGLRVPGLLDSSGQLVPATLVAGEVVVDASLNPADFTPSANGQRQVDIGPSATLADVDPALSVYQQGTGSSRRDVLADVQALAEGLRKPIVSDSTFPVPTGSLTQTQFASLMSDGLSRLDSHIGHLSDVRTGIGTRLNQLDVQTNIRAESSLQLQTTLSSLQDVDYADAIARLNQQLTGIQAAQQVFTKVQGLSLFNYL